MFDIIYIYIYIFIWKKSANRLSCLARLYTGEMAAEPMAKPLPMAAVVLPAASKASVRRRTWGKESTESVWDILGYLGISHDKTW